MSTDNPTKINRLLNNQPSGTVLLSSWLANQGYSTELQRRYRKSGWLDSLGHGAMIRAGDHVDYTGAIYGLQRQLGSHVHPGGRTALILQGKSQYLELVAKKVVLFGPAREPLPRWFKSHDWNLELEYYQSSFLPADMSMTEVALKSYTIKVSAPARALMECLYLAPDHQNLMECYELMESMNNLRPTLVQQLLEQCRSIKVKRLFLYMAEKANHDWFRYIDLKKIDLGKGKRHISQNGVYSSKYQITIPKELENNAEPNL